MRYFILCLLLVAPLCAHGAVIINEVAWMGTLVSANDEWVELYNTGGSSVSLDGWVLSDSGSLQIPLTGSIGALSYAVLERTDDDTVPGTAFVVYTGALTNTGTTLTLKRADSSIEDQVAGGENWVNIGGDNVLKHTPQYTSSGWTTAVQTPGSASPAYVPPTEDETDDVEDTQDDDEEEGSEDEQTPETTVKISSNDGGKKVEWKALNSVLSLVLVGPEVVYINQPVLFSVESKGLGQTALNSLSYEWNFGDFMTGTHKEEHHTFMYAGEYVVTVRASFGEHIQIARKTVTVLPVAFSLARNTRGDILLHNNAKYEVDVSGYSLRGLSKMTFPKQSIILPNATIAINKERLNVSNVTNVRLYDQEGELVASTQASPLLPPSLPLVQPKDLKPLVSSSIILDTDVLPVVQKMSSSNFMFKDEVVKSMENATTGSPTTSLTKTEKTVVPDTNKSSLPQGALAYLGLFGVLAVAVLAVFVGRTR